MTRPQLTCLRGKVAVPPCLELFGADKKHTENWRGRGKHGTWLGDAFFVSFWFASPRLCLCVLCIFWGGEFGIFVLTFTPFYAFTHIIFSMVSGFLWFFTHSFDVAFEIGGEEKFLQRAVLVSLAMQQTVAI